MWNAANAGRGNNTVLEIINHKNWSYWTDNKSGKFNKVGGWHAISEVNEITGQHAVEGFIRQRIFEKANNIDQLLDKLIKKKWDVIF